MHLYLQLFNIVYIIQSVAPEDMTNITAQYIVRSHQAVRHALNTNVVLSLINLSISP